MTTYAPDTYLTPITITTGVNDVFVVTEDPAGTPAVVTVTIDAGTWYLHADSSFNSTVKGLLWAIQKVLNDGTTANLGTRSGTPSNTYAWEVATPTSSTGMTNNGLALRSTTTTDFEISFTHTSFSMSPRWFGFASDSPGADIASATDGGDEVVTMPASTRHRMVTRDIGDGHAVDKRRHHYKDVRWSSRRPSDSVAVVWDEGFYREIVYEDVRGVDVHQRRALEAEWAGTSTRLTGDWHATWYDVWDALAVGDEVLIVHNSSDDLQVDTHKYELVRAWEPPNWDAMASQQSPRGDYYTLSMAVWVDPDVSSYDH
jgi:hypothetical protein